MKYHWFRFRTRAQRKISTAEQERAAKPWPVAPLIRKNTPVKRPQQIITTMKSKYGL